MSIIGFVTMGIDKYKAKAKQWRIPEKTLLLVAFIGGGIGTAIGMKTFRHKTKHPKFTILVPLSAVLYVVVSGYLINIIK
ncbi:MAG TPA: DUF1294 domain-containing protein [Clostridiales bacterium]|nr:DUF1294 domain-containing protein [Clostridiales bacterium]